MFDLLNTLLLITVGLVIVVPVLNVIASSFSSSAHILAGNVTIYPRGFTLESYERILRYKLVLSGFLNSLFYVVAGTSLNLMLTVFLAYPLSRKDLRGLAVIGIFVLIPMFFRGGIVPTFLLVNSLGLVNTRWAVILPAGLSIWNTIVARTYFANLPRELTEASEIDGCSDFRFFAQIVLPLSRPILAVLVLLYAIDHWNSYFNALLYLFDESLFPLQLVLARILIINESIIAQAHGGRGYRHPHAHGEHGDLADAQVRAYRGCQRADDDPLPVHPETFRQGRDDRVHQGIAGCDWRCTCRASRGSAGPWPARSASPTWCAECRWAPTGRRRRTARL